MTHLYMSKTSRVQEGSGRFAGKGNGDGNIMVVTRKHCLRTSDGSGRVGDLSFFVVDFVVFSLR